MSRLYTVSYLYCKRMLCCPARLGLHKNGPLDRLEKYIDCYKFLLFIFYLECLRRVQSSEPLHAIMNPTLLVWITVCMCPNRDLFRRTVLQKCVRDINCSLDYGSWVKNSNIPYPNQNRASPWRIFSSNKSAPANRKTAFHANCDPNKQEIRFVFAWSGSELWSLFKYSRGKLKNQKPIAVDVLFKAYPMVPLSCRSNLAGR